MDYTEVYKEILDHLEHKKKFALIRLGDGEFLTMSQKKIDYVATRQFNYVPPQPDLDYISKIVADAYTNADIIGTPTQHHVEHCGSYWAEAQPFLEKIRPSTKHIQKCSIDVHSELLHSGMLDMLLDKRDRLIYISGRNLDEGFKRKYNIGKIESFIVNAEQKFEKEKKIGHWPHQFTECVKWIKSLDATGTLCLVGAGVLGKTYASLLKDQGGIVCEIGHVFDSWAGKITRGTGRGADAIDTTYML